MVIGVDIRQYFANLRKAAARPDAPCQMIAADFESLSHQVQKEIGLSTYLVPVLVGYSSGATVVYATLVQSPPGTFAGALSLGFCAEQDFAGATCAPAQACTTHPTRSMSSCSSRPWPSSNRGSHFRGRKTRSATAHAADDLSPQVASGQIVRLPLVGHGFSVERNWMPQFRQAYARLTALQKSAPGERPRTSAICRFRKCTRAALRTSSRCCSPATAAGRDSIKSSRRASPPPACQRSR